MIKKTAFTLLEIIVAMAVSAILLSLGLIGITTIQRVARDNQRIAVMTEIAKQIGRYQRTYLEYPSSSQMSLQDSVFAIDGKEYIRLDGFLKSGENSNPAETLYYIAVDSKNAISICVLLESSVIEKFENSTCPDSTESWN